MNKGHICSSCLQAKTQNNSGYNNLITTGEEESPTFSFHIPTSQLLHCGREMGEGQEKLDWFNLQV